LACPAERIAAMLRRAPKSSGAEAQSPYQHSCCQHHLETPPFQYFQQAEGNTNYVSSPTRRQSIPSAMIGVVDNDVDPSLIIISSAASAMACLEYHHGRQN
jgi:hypothetical protein